MNHEEDEFPDVSLLEEEQTRDEAEFDFDFDLDGFEVDLNTQDDLDTAVLKPRVFRPKKVLYDRAVDLAKDLDLEKDSNRFCFVSGNFIFGDLIEALIIGRKMLVRELYVSTLSLPQDNVDSLVNVMMSGRCKHLHLILSSYFYAHERNDLIKYIYQELNGKDWDFTMSVAGIHVKMVLMQTDQGLFYTLHGSANLRSSRCIEQFEITEDRELFEFGKKFLDKVEEGYSVVKRSGKRANELWQSVQ